MKEAGLPESRAAVGVGGENQDWRKQKKIGTVFMLYLTH